MFTPDYKLVHPQTKELVAIFQGYTDNGEEMWLTQNGLEKCKFEGFKDSGWTIWSQDVSDFANVVELSD